MDGDIEKKVRNCPRCIRRKAKDKTAANLVVVESTYPMDVCMDFLFLEMSSGGHEHILVITDHFTRFAQAFPTRNQTAKTTATLLFDNFVCHYITAFQRTFIQITAVILKGRLSKSSVPLPRLTSLAQLHTIRWETGCPKVLIRLCSTCSVRLKRNRNLIGNRRYLR